jgi:hypothetical protein
MNLKKTLVILAVLSFVGCASSKSKPTSTQPNASATKSSSTSSAQAAPSAAPTKLSCTRDTETRVLEIVAQGGGCSLNYTKEGKTSPVASSSHGTKHCADSQKKISTKLEKAGFKCS